MVPDVPGMSVIMVGRYMAHSTRAFASFYRHHRAAAASPYVTYDAARLPAMPLLRVITRDGWRLLGHPRPPAPPPPERKTKAPPGLLFTFHPSLFTAPIKMGA